MPRVGMLGINRKLTLIASLAMMARSQDNVFMTSPDEARRIDDRQFKSKPKKVKPKGTLFNINGIEIDALNYKNAERKYKNMVKSAPK